MTINFPTRSYPCVILDGVRQTKYPDGVQPTYYNVYPIVSDGIFSNDTISNTSATYYIVSADSSDRWTFYDGGAYQFDASSAVGGSTAAPGDYVATYMVVDYNGSGTNASATVTVTVT